MSQMTNEQKEQYENWESVELPYKIVGEYYPNLKKYNEEVDTVVKIVDILSCSNTYPKELKRTIFWKLTFGKTEDGYYFAWSNNIKPFKKDVEQYGCPQELIKSKIGDYVRIKGYVGSFSEYREKIETITNQWLKHPKNSLEKSRPFLNEDGNRPKYIKLDKCRIIENKGNYENSNN